jgi:hypothetical protein
MPVKKMTDRRKIGIVDEPLVPKKTGNPKGMDGDEF